MQVVLYDRTTTLVDAGDELLAPVFMLAGPCFGDGN
jgi:hypothetical protein